jgi:flagellar motor switch protein FliG
MQDRQANLRKAAVLVASLDRQTAARLLEQMSLDQADRVRQMIDDMGPLDPLEQNDVIEEFFRIGPMVPDRQPAGIELDSSLARRLAMSDESASAPFDTVRHARGHALPLEQSFSRSTSRQSPKHRDAPPFRFLNDAPSDVLATCLEREHPQTIAVVLSHLLPDQAADVLASFAPTLQTEVARRLVNLDETDPEILREVEQSLEQWLAEHVRSDRRRSAGMAALSSILEASEHRTQQDILANLARHDRRLAGQLRMQQPTPKPAARRWTFDDVAELDDAALIAVLHRSDAEIVVLSLAGAKSALVERVVRQLPLGEGKTLRYALDNLGPTRLSDVEQAQQHLADLANHLEQTGVIERKVRRSLSLAI